MIGWRKPTLLGLTPSVNCLLLNCQVASWQIIDVLEMLIGYGENMSDIVRPLSYSDEGSDLVILVNEISLLYRVMLILNALH
jgi:hypothetical protein